MKCAVKNCVNEQKNKGDKVSFFLFPKNKKLLKQWLDFCGTNQPFKEKTWRVCMEHFKNEDIQGDMQFEMGLSTKRTLMPGVVPCINGNTEAKPQQPLKRLQRSINKKTAGNIDSDLVVDLKEVQDKSESEKEVRIIEAQRKCDSSKIVKEIALSCAGSSLSTSSSCSEPSRSSFPHQATTVGSNQITDLLNIEHRSTSCISDNHTFSLPDVASIKLLQPIKKFHQSYLKGYALENNDRTEIARSIIEECLKDTPEKELDSEDFVKLAEIIERIFPTEFVFTYFSPSLREKHGRGKLWNAYTDNKRLKAFLNAKTTLPNANTIKILPPIQKIYKKFQQGKPLDNKDRLIIAKAVIDASLEENPNKILFQENLHQLANGIVKAFPSETKETYFMPTIKKLQKRGKLVNAYNKKRKTLRADGVIKSLSQECI